MTNSGMLFQEFKLATQQICKDLSIEYENVEFVRYETQKTGLDYDATIHTELPRFSFHLKTTTKDVDPTSGSMDAWLEIAYSESTGSFALGENVDNMRGRSDFLQRWAARAVGQYNMRHNTANLESLFHDVNIMMCGIPQDMRSVSMFEFLMSGILSSDVNKVHIYIFRHVEEVTYYRTYSYAISPIRVDRGDDWFIFWRFASPDSGAASKKFDIANKWISRMSSISKIEYFDVDDIDLGRFLKANSINEHIFSELPQTRPRNMLVNTDAFGEDFSKQYDDFDEKFETYSHAERMRSLRTLVQTALEETCTRHEVELVEDAKKTIDRLSADLVKNEIIEPPLKKWFEVFCDVANRSAHRNYPSDDDLLDELNERQYDTCIDIGIWLISKLGETMSTDAEYESNV